MHSSLGYLAPADVEAHWRWERIPVQDFGLEVA
jgi:hypothetical protein